MRVTEFINFSKWQWPDHKESLLIDYSSLPHRALGRTDACADGRHVFGNDDHDCVDCGVEICHDYHDGVLCSLETEHSGNHQNRWHPSRWWKR